MSRVRPGMSNLTPFPASRLVLWYRRGDHPSSHRPETRLEVRNAFFLSLSVWIVTREESCDVAPLRTGRLLKATVHAKNVRLHEEHCGGRKIRSTCAAVRCLHDAAVSRACMNILLVVTCVFSRPLVDLYNRCCSRYVMLISGCFFALNSDQRESDAFFLRRNMDITK